MRRRLRLLPVLWLLGLLAAPGVAYVLGARQPLLENRAATPYPKITADALTHRATFGALDAALLERLPLRDTALDLRGRITVDVARDSPNANVAIGSKGWLYLVEEVRSCRDDGRPIGDPADAAEIVARTLVASGRRTMILWAGSKLFIHPQNAPSIDPDLERCAREIEERVERRLARTPGGSNLDDPLRALERRGEATFLRSDSHWNTTGRLLFARMVLDFVRPGLAEDVGLRAGAESERPGDLGTLMGIARKDRDRFVEVSRPPTDPLPAGQVVLIGDSQLYNTFVTQFPPAKPSLLSTALPGQGTCDWPMTLAGQCDAAILASGTTVIEAVGRNAINFTQACWRITALAAEKLRGGAAAWRSVQGSAAADADGTIALPRGGSVTVAVKPRDGDRASIPRLILIPIEALAPAGPGAPPPAVAMTQQPAAGTGIVPCAMPSQSVVGGSLVLPLPAGRPASSIPVRLDAPAGTVLGAPRIVPLDGTERTRRRR